MKKEPLEEEGGETNCSYLETSYLGPALIQEMKDFPCDWIMRQNKFMEVLEAESHLIPSAAGRQAACPVPVGHQQQHGVEFVVAESVGLAVTPWV